MQEQPEQYRVIINESALREFFNVYFDDMCAFLNYYTHDKQLIEDTIQDVFVKLWEDRSAVNISFIKTYLYNACRNRILNHLRNEQNRSSLLGEWAKRELEKQKAEDCVNREEFSDIYRQAVDSLPEKCREIFLLSKDQNKTYRDISEEKGLSIKTVEAQMSIAIKKIKEYILLFYCNI